MRRMGYCLKSSRPEEINAALLLPWDYAICTDTFWVSEVLHHNPELLQKLQLKGRNQQLLVFERSAGGQKNTPEALTDRFWQVLSDTTLESTDAEFLLSTSLPATSSGKIMYYGTLMADPSVSLKATVALFKNGEKTALAERILPANGTFSITEIPIPAAPADEMRVYLWNSEHKNVGLESFRVLISR